MMIISPILQDGESIPPLQPQAIAKNPSRFRLQIATERTNTSAPSWFTTPSLLTFSDVSLYAAGQQLSPF
jgi:hypothetical protein